MAWDYCAQGARGKRLTLSAIVIQAVYRGMAARKELRKARTAATTIQRSWRGYVERREQEKRLREASAVKIQTSWRMYVLLPSFLAVLDDSTLCTADEL
jgi:myosin-5